MSTSTIVIPAKQLKEVWRLLKTERWKNQLVVMDGYSSHIRLEVCDFIGIHVTIQQGIDSTPTAFPIMVNWKDMNDLIKSWKRVKDELVTFTATTETADDVVVEFRGVETVMSPSDVRFVRSIESFFQMDELCRPVLLVDGVALGKGLNYCKAAMSVDDDRHTYLENIAIEIEDKESTGGEFERCHIRVLALNGYVLHVVEGIAGRESTSCTVSEDTLSGAYGRDSVADRVLPESIIPHLLKTLPQALENEITICSYVHRWEEPGQYTEKMIPKRQVWLEVTVPLPDSTVTYYATDSRAGNALPDWNSLTNGIADITITLPYEKVHQALDELAMGMKGESYKYVWVQLHEDYVQLIGQCRWSRDERGRIAVPATIQLAYPISDDDEMTSLPEINTQSGKLQIAFNIDYLKAACTLPDQPQTIYWLFGYPTLARGKERGMPLYGRIGYGKVQNAYDQPTVYAIVMPLDI